VYDYLSGRLAESGPDEVVVEVAGVGYRLLVSGATSGRLPAVGESVTLFTQYMIRDERALLFGFASREERALFERLLGVSKVGPAIALSLLSALQPDRLAAAVDGGDVAALSAVKGVGRRTAERLCVELKGRLGAVTALPGAVTDRCSSVAAALVALGYPRASARAAAAAVAAGAEGQASLAELAKQGLARIGSASAALGRSE